jgi:hypothetical protein
VNTAGPNVRAFALDIWVDDGNILAIEDYNVGECIDANCGYGIFMGTIVIDGSGVVTDDGTPVAELADLPSDTLPGPPDSNGVTTEMGTLYEVGVVPGPAQTSGTLFKIVVSTVPCNLCITTNFSRAGIVLENGDSSEDISPSFTTNVSPSSPLCVPLAGAGCATCVGDVIAPWDIVNTADYDIVAGDLTMAFIFTGKWIINGPDDPNLGESGIFGNYWKDCSDMDDDGDIDLFDHDILQGNLTLEYIIYDDWEYNCGAYEP